MAEDPTPLQQAQLDEGQAERRWKDAWAIRHTSQRAHQIIETIRAPQGIRDQLYEMILAQERVDQELQPGDGTDWENCGFKIISRYFNGKIAQIQIEQHRAKQKSRAAKEPKAGSDSKIPWKPNWGKQSCALCVAIESAGSGGITENKLTEICGREPAKILQEWKRSKNTVKARLSQEIKEFRANGFYFCPPKYLTP